MKKISIFARKITKNDNFRHFRTQFCLSYFHTFQDITSMGLTAAADKITRQDIHHLNRRIREGPLLSPSYGNSYDGRFYHHFMIKR